ncbi:caspase family protein [Pseudorhodobacter sp.]|uniref:caspase family protein n=1 Tax=Pseudorhodobacter sp. TaxID=1934400 RepID=UPI002648C98F|nr:caspase family protein [Pseudorhodobacter sp.]MDN5786745.1 caspase family protein [Pseudorhodobacter sp.]
MRGNKLTIPDFGLSPKAILPALALCIVTAGAGAAEAERLALVVGNADYTNVAPLRNAVRDAHDISESLKRLGFEVTLLTDIHGSDFWAKVDAFADEAKNADSTVFFYSGHAFQMNGANYLVPVDAKLTSRDSIQTETWNLDGIIARLQDRKRQTLIFLDACRNDPLPQSVRGTGAASDGLARLQTGVGTFVAFATEPGAVTYDGAGEAPNSPFTTALLDHIETPGISVSDMMIEVRNEVEDRTFRKQTPWDQSSLREQFYFNPVAESKQELSEADFELLAQLAPDDRKKFLDLLRASGFSDSSLRDADTAIEVASLGLEMAADNGGVTIGDAKPAGGESVGATVTDAAPAAADAGPTIDVAALEVVAGGGTVTDAPTTQTETVAAAVTEIVPPQTIASIPETTLPLLPQDPAAAALDGEARIRLAALTWQTRGIIGINAITVDRLRVEGNIIKPDSDKNRQLLASIDPSLLQDHSTPEVNPADLAKLAQTELRRIGCYQMGIDGDWGKGSRTALTSYYLAKRKVPDSLEPSVGLVQALTAESSVVCAVRVSSVAPAVRARAKAQVKATQVSVESTGTRKINPVTKRKINAPAKVKKEIKKSLLGSGSF